MRASTPVVAIVGMCLGAVSVAHAEVELKNDGFESGQAVAFQGGFVAGEIGAARFVAPDAGRQLLKVQLLFGPEQTTGNTQTVTLKVYDDSAGTDAPGGELFSGDFQITGSNDALHELVLPGQTIVPQQFRVGILLQHSNAPSLAADNDGTHDPTKNFIFASGLGWRTAATFGLTRDFVIRAFVSGTGGIVPDGPGGDDAGAGAGGCSGNAECPAGQFCDTAAGACTFECRVDEDCGGGTCNSLGQCVGGSGSDGGGCCQSGRGGPLGSLVLGLGVLGLLIVRRRGRRTESEP